jgi:hypothetical protein
MSRLLAGAAFGALLALAVPPAALAEEEASNADEQTASDEGGSFGISPFELGGGGPFFSALVVNPAGPSAEFGMLYGGKGFTYPTAWLRLSGIGFGGGYGYGKQTGAGFGMGGLALELIPRDGKKVEFPVGVALCFGGGGQTIMVTDEETGQTRKVSESGFIFMPIPSIGVELNPARLFKVGFSSQFVLAVAEPENFWGFGASVWLAFGQVWPAEG